MQPGHFLALSIDVEPFELASNLEKEAYLGFACGHLFQWTGYVIPREIPPFPDGARLVCARIQDC